MGLKCTVPGCGRTINAWTGLQEIQKLQQHFARAHAMILWMKAALEVRLEMEAGKVPERYTTLLAIRARETLDALDDISRGNR